MLCAMPSDVGPVAGRIWTVGRFGRCPSSAVHARIFGGLEQGFPYGFEAIIGEDLGAKLRWMPHEKLNSVPVCLIRLAHFTSH